MRKFFSSLSVSKKLAAVFLFLLLMMGVGGSVGLYNARQISNVTERLYINSFKRGELLSTVENEFLSARHEIFLQTIVGETALKSFLDVSVDERRKKIDRLLIEYKGMGLARGVEDIYNSLIENLGIYWLIHQNVSELSRKGQRDEALSIIRMEGNKSFMDTVSALNKLIGEEKDAAYDAYHESDFFAKSIIGVTFFVTLLAVIIAAALWRTLTRAIVRPILLIEESAKKVGEGDLKQRIPVMTGDEIGSLASQFNRMADRLEEQYATLEKRVEKRTEELKIANEDLKKKKQEIEGANIGLQEANRMKSQFLANVSHELRTPLNSIIGFSELLEERAFGELNERQTQYIDFIHSSGGHLLALINSILDLSKIEAGRLELRPEVFSISEALTELMGIIRPIAHKRGIAIETRAVLASPRIRADKANFKQIMLNLISNAVKFNLDNGKVTVDWEITEEPGRAEFQRYVVFKIKDTGIGIKDEDKGRLFKEFEQIDSSITREYGGTGLGLALTKRLVELHGGQIWFDSVPGKGSVFYVKLPQGTDEIDLPAPLSAVSLKPFLPASSARPGVLLAGEGENINRLLEIYLSGAAYEVAIASDGLDLVTKAATHRPFAIIMGITIPKMDGWAALKELKSNPRTSGIPVIIISSRGDRQHGLDLGAFDYLEKPVNREKLLSALSRIDKDGRKTGTG